MSMYLWCHKNAGLRSLYFIIFYLIVQLVYTDAHAATLLKFNQKFFLPKEQICETKMYVEATRMRSDNVCPDSNISIIFHKSWKYVLQVNHKDKTYTKKTADDINTLQTKQIEETKKAAKEIAKTKPTVAAKVNSILADIEKRTKERSFQKPVVKSTEKTRMIHDKSCKLFEVSVKSQPSQDICITTWEKLPKLALLKPLMIQSLVFLLDSGDPTVEIRKKGLALEQTNYNNGKPFYTIQLVDMSEEQKPDNFFSVPFSYKVAEKTNPYLKLLNIDIKK